MGTRVRGVAVIVLVLATGAVLGTWISQWLVTPGAPVTIELPEEFPWPGERVRVQVLNGGGRSGMAREATGFLRDAGFDVVEVGNLGTFDQDSSRVVDRGSELGAARAIADLLGIREVRREEGEDENLYVDVTVVLGQDWSPEQVSVPEMGDDPRPWWDIRRILEYLRRPGQAAPGGARLVDPETEQNGG